MGEGTREQLEEALCEIGRRVWQRGFVASNDGNFSARIGPGRVLATPTLISKGFMTPQDLVVLDSEGNQLEGKRKPTSEIRIHLNIYKRRPDINAVVHVHPPHATAFCIAHRQIPKCILPEVEFFLGQIPIAPYETPGTWEFARSIDPYVANHDVVLLMNHGAVAMGKDPLDAYYKMETLDHYCRILLLAKALGDWNQIDLSMMDKLLKAKEAWGIADQREGLSPAEKCREGVAECPDVGLRSRVESMVREALRALPS